MRETVPKPATANTYVDHVFKVKVADAVASDRDAWSLTNATCCRRS